ncbi:MAG: lipopolysaccharide biosynthesis protein [Planctomycetota bacterium]|jgi:O-antigen/teichoic acid export membrane protein
MNNKAVTTSKRLIHNTIFNISAYVASAAIALFMVPFLIRCLGKEIYGIWILIGSVFAYAMMLQMGLSSAINRYVPVFLAKSNTEGVRQTVSTATFFFSAIGLVLIVFAMVLYKNVNTWFSNSIPADLVSTTRMLVLIVGLCFACIMPLQPYASVVTGLQRYDIYSLTRIIPIAVRTLVLVVLLSMGFGVLTVGLMYGLCETSTRISLLIYSKILLKEKMLSIKAVNFRLLREMIAYGVNTFLYLMGAAIIYKASDIIIGVFLTAEDITRFSVSTAALLMLSMLLQTFSAAIKPAVSDLDARDDETRIREIAFLTQKYSLILLIPACSFLIIMGRDILTVWVGKEFGGLHLILTILTIGHFLRLAQHSNFLVLVGKGEHRIFGLLTILMGLLCVGLAIISVVVFKKGLLGIAISNLIPMSLISGLALPIYFNWKMKIATRDSIIYIWWPALLGCLPTIALIGIWKYLVSPDSWLEIFAIVIAAMAVTFTCSWFLSLEPSERKRFIGVAVSYKLIR